MKPARERSGLREYFGNIARASASIFEGLSVTMSWMFRRPVTIQYPDKIAEPVQEMLPEGYRGVLEVDIQRCIGCLLCQRTCPIDCIDIEVRKNPETNAREITRFTIDIGRCMFCGLCTEAAPDCDAIRHTPQFEATVPRAEQLVLHFVDRPVPVVKRNEAPARRPLGSILAGVIPEFGRRTGSKKWRGRCAPAVEEPDAPQSQAATAQAPEAGEATAPPAASPASPATSPVTEATTAPVTETLTAPVSETTTTAAGDMARTGAAQEDRKDGR